MLGKSIGTVSLKTESSFWKVKRTGVRHCLLNSRSVKSLTGQDRYLPPTVYKSNSETLLIDYKKEGTDDIGFPLSEAWIGEPVKHWYRLESNGYQKWYVWQ